MYYLPLFVNQSRFHYCKLQPTGLDQTVPDFSFVVQQAPGHQVELFRIYGETDFISARGTSADLPFSLRETGVVSRWEADQHRFVIELHPGKGKQMPAETHNENIAASGLVWKTDPAGGDLYLTYKGMTTQPITIIVQLHQEGQQIFSGKFKLHTGVQERIFDAVFDFGSEASQIAFHQRRTEPSPDPRINMVDRLLFGFYAPALRTGKLTRNPVGEDGDNLTLSNVQRERFMPYDAHTDGTVNKYFFNSNFFVRRSYRGENNADPSPHLAPFAEGNGEWVSLLGDTYDRRYMIPENDEDYEIIPNLKLAELGLTRSFSLMINDRLGEFANEEIQEDIFRRVMGQFMHILFRELDDRVRKTKNKLLKLTLLVPNIYSQLRVNALVANLYQDIAAIIAEGGYGFSGFEVQTLSESDAALLGLLTDTGVAGVGFDKIKPKDNCLVVDSGKGTTDISILTIGRNNEFGSVFRSGFAGAGNALTYAFADTLFAMILGPDDIAKREQFLKKFLEYQRDLGSVYAFHRHLETIKKNFHRHEDPQYTYTPEQFKELGFDLNVDNYRNLLWQKLRDHFSRPGKTFQDYFGIIENTIDRMVRMTIDRLKESGVARFNLVVLSGRSFLMKEYRDRMEAALRAEFKVDQVFFARENLKKSCLFGPLNHPNGTNFNSDLVGTPVFTSKGGRFRRFRSFFNFDRNSAELSDENFFLRGITVRHDETVTICGRKPLLRNIPAGYDANLIYVGEDFLVRTEETCDKLDFGFRTGQTVETDALAWMSLFPHVGGPGHVTPPLRYPQAPEESPTTTTPTTNTTTTTTTPTSQSAPTPTAGRPSPFENDDMWNDI